MSRFTGDFLGFQLGPIYSDFINITRVSTGDRYQDDLIPTFADQTLQVPGGDGTYYWNTNYTQKTFTIDFAFDNLRDEDIRRLRLMFGSRDIQPLIFDEYPYKKYMVKAAQPPQIKYICFDKDNIRIYKGEGMAQLIAYYPFGIATVEPNLDSSSTTNVVNNAGDMEANFKIYYALSDLSDGEISLTLETLSGTTLGTLVLEDIVANTGDTYFCIDSRVHLIEGMDENFNKTGTLYNRFITSGDFFRAPVGQSVLAIPQNYPNFVKANYVPLYY